MFAVKLELEYFAEANQDEDDMARKIEKKSRETMNELSGAERMIIGAQMFDEFRAKIIASLPKDLPEEEFKKRLFERIYGSPMEEFLSGAVDDRSVRR